MVYKVKISPSAEKDLRNAFDYIYRKLENPLAAGSFLREYYRTLKRLSIIADGLKIIEETDLAKYKYRIIHMSHYSYKLLYRIEGNEVIVDAFIHNLQILKPPTKNS